MSSLSKNTQKAYRHYQTLSQEVEALTGLELPAGVEIEIKL